MILGIDPGMTGALAWLTDAGELVHIEDMPTVEIKVGNGKRRQVNAALLAHMLIERRPVHVVLEHVATKPTDGVVGAFSFGRGFGTLEGVIAGLRIGHTLVKPQVWKRALHVTDDKDFARQRAMQMFPSNAQLFARKKDDGRAEAAMIGSWGVQLLQLGRAA